MHPTYTRLAIILASLAAIGPFSIDTYLPAFHAMEADLGTSRYAVQQSLTVYMLTFAVMVLWHGALSDGFGRRRVLVVAMGLFTLASVVCALAPSIEWVWIGRALQGVSGGAGMVIGRAIVRDVLDGPDAQRMMSQVVMMFALAPAVAPVIGGWILLFADWRAIFAFLALYGGVVTVVCRQVLPETLPPEKRQPLHPLPLARAYGAVLRKPAFLLLTGAQALNFNGFFVYVLSAPTFLVDHLGRSPQAFAWLFVPAMGGLLAGSWLSGRVAGHWSPHRSVAVGYAVMGVAALANLLISALMAPGLPHSVAPLALYTLGMSLTMPALTLMALELFPLRRGLASSCQSFMQMALNAVTAALTAPLLWGSVQTLSLGMAAYLSLGALAAAAVLRGAAAH
ncbi:multidrug effflux MFS transporter [Denitromonas iodatirespirans]|uniref:Bcr/CflA family efflux transporter n=1 Tax=Denitromonas iodatirespirans TaxID=2795389 RepID=A0A944D522_DENI1|nr:multidrug effflux MFS transporter [Denitromonas iodatirespirans]MBT0960074.1 multidrug effflux MFS transporter [Denitromonas iodatirespirans]